MRTAAILPELRRLALRLPLLAPALGIWAGAAFLGTSPPWLTAGTGLAALALTLLPRARRLAPLWLFTAAACTGALCRHFTREEGCPPPDAPAAEAVAVVEREEPEPDGRVSLALTLRALRGPAGFSPARCGALLSTGRRLPEAAEGDTVWLQAVDWEPPAHLVNPGSGDSAEPLTDEGIRRVGSLADGAGLLVLAPASAPRRFFGELRRRFLAAADAALPAGPARASLLAVAIGVRSELDAAERDAFVDSGLGHLLEPGGLDLALLLVVLHLAFARAWSTSERRLLLLPARRAADLLCLPWPWAWALAAGGRSAALRAAGIATAWLAARALGRGRPPGAHLWTAAALVGFGLWPDAALDPRVWGVALLLLGLFGLGPPLARILGGPQRPGTRAAMRRAAGRAFGFGVAAWAAALPLVAASAHRISAFSLPAQVAALPVAAAVGLASAPVLGALAVGSAPAWAFQPAFALARLLAALAAAAARPWARVVLPELPLPVWVAFGLCAAATAAALRAGGLPLSGRLGGGRPARAVALASAAVGVAGIALSRLTPPGLRITFLSVGQGDSEVVELPLGGALVVDGGGNAVGSFDPGRRIVAPFLWSRGIGGLRAVALSHPHPDHANGLAAVFDDFGVGEFWATAEPCPLAACREIDRVIAERSIPRRRFTAQARDLTIEGVRIEALYPLTPEGYCPDLQENDNSLVLRLRYGDFTALLVGDIEAAAEARLEASGADLAADVLKAPHHGSDTSSGPELVRRVHPKAVVFCVGPRNRFGFPRPEVVARWRAAGAATFRTDQDGAVTIESSGHGFRVVTARSRR